MYSLISSQYYRYTELMSQNLGHYLQLHSVLSAGVEMETQKRPMNCLKMDKEQVTWNLLNKCFFISYEYLLFYRSKSS